MIHSGLFFKARPPVGFLVSANVETESKGVTGNNTTTIATTGDNKAAFNSVDFGYAAGLGFQAESGPLVGLRYNGGLSEHPEK